MQATLGPFGFAEAVNTKRSASPAWVAVGAHVAVILAIFVWSAQRKFAPPMIRPLAPVANLVDPPPPMTMSANVGSASGGQNAQQLAAGHLPKPSPVQIMPLAKPILQPDRSVEPAVVTDLKMPVNNLLNLGMPTATSPVGSFGPGTGGVGKGDGPGAGLGGHGADGVLHPGSGGVRAPVLVRQVDAEFSEDARKAKFSGNVQVYLWVDEQGNPSHVRVVRGVGMGLDEKAVEAVRQYKFKPATQNGKPVKVDLYVDVNFRIF